MVQNLLSTYQQTHLRPNSDKFKVLFTVGDFDFGWYPFLFILGFFVAIIIGCLVAHYRYKIKYDLIFWYSFVLIPSAIIGARFWSACIGDLKWENFFNFKSGGLAIQGGVVFAGIAGIIYFLLMLRRPKYFVRVEQGDNVYIQKVSLWVIIDIALPLILIGQAVGRWGNFFNGEIFGPQTSAESLQWLKNIMPGVFDHMQAVVEPGTNSLLVNGAYYQPLFLYESFTNIIFFIVVYCFVPNIKKIRAGVVGSSYFIIYGVIRFCFEPLRFQAFEFKGTYIINGILLSFGLILLVIAQFIAPRFRDKQIWYYIWITKVRIVFIKLGVKLKFNWALKYTYKDKNLENYGLEAKTDFIRTPENMIFYANR